MSTQERASRANRLQGLKEKLAAESSNGVLGAIGATGAAALPTQEEAADTTEASAVLATTIDRRIGAEELTAPERPTVDSMPLKRKPSAAEDPFVRRDDPTPRPQGVVFYVGDKRRIRALNAYFEAQGIGFGRRGNVSIYAGAGIRLLYELMQRDPLALQEAVRATLLERKAPRSTNAS